MLIVNFKTYEQGTGDKALALVSKIESISKETQIKMVVCLQAADIKEAFVQTTLEIWAQHVDAVDFGSHTGSTVAQAVYKDGAIGTLLNHSEHRFASFETLSQAHTKAREVGLKTLIFAKDLQELEQVLALEPNFVSFEPPDLVGSKTTSVAQAEPENIRKAVAIANTRSIPLLVGAGIKSSQDVSVSLQLGATGVVVASDIVTAQDPEGEIRELIQGF